MQTRERASTRARTTRNLDTDLIAQARRALGTSGTTETIHAALADTSVWGKRHLLGPAVRGWFERPDVAQAIAT
jgi:Arc/MetJ family transcription regulator